MIEQTNKQTRTNERTIIELVDIDRRPSSQACALNINCILIFPSVPIEARRRSACRVMPLTSLVLLEERTKHTHKCHTITPSHAGAKLARLSRAAALVAIIVACKRQRPLLLLSHTHTQLAAKLRQVCAKFNTPRSTLIDTTQLMVTYSEALLRTHLNVT